MQRKRSIASATLTLVVCVILSLGVWQGVASASTNTIDFSATIRGPYACPGPCASATEFTLNGIANADAKSLGTMTYTGAGVVLDFDPVANCLVQSENFAFTTQNGRDGKDTFYVATTFDALCFTDDPNVLNETATFDITGGTGRFAGATGSEALPSRRSRTRRGAREQSAQRSATNVPTPGPGLGHSFLPRSFVRPQACSMTFPTKGRSGSSSLRDGNLRLRRGHPRDDFVGVEVAAQPKRPVLKAQRERRLASTGRSTVNAAELARVGGGGLTRFRGQGAVPRVRWSRVS